MSDNYPRHGDPQKLQSYPTVSKNKDGSLTHHGPKAPDEPAKPPAVAKGPSQREVQWRSGMGMPAGGSSKGTVGAPAGAPASAPASGRKPRTPEEMAQIEATFQKFHDQHYEAPVKLPALTTRDMIKFDDAVLTKVLDFEDNLALAGHSEKAEEARAAFDKTVRKALLDCRKAIVGFKSTLDDMKDTTSQGKSAANDIDGASTVIATAIKSLNAGQFAVSMGQFKVAYGYLKSSQEWAAIAFEASDAAAARDIKVLQETREACEGLLTVLGAGLEAGAFKLVVAAVPALARGAEKLSNNWNGIDDKTSWAEILSRGLIDVGFTALGNFFDKKYFEGINYGAKFAIRDKNTLAFISKNSYAIVMGIAKECWQRASSTAIGMHYGEPPEKLKTGILEAMYTEYSRDTAGTMFFKQMELLGHVMPK